METGHSNQLIDKGYFMADKDEICRSKDRLTHESCALLFLNCFQIGREGEGTSRNHNLEILAFSMFLSL